MNVPGLSVSSMKFNYEPSEAFLMSLLFLFLYHLFQLLEEVFLSILVTYAETFYNFSRISSVTIADDELWVQLISVLVTF